ncbi:MAG: tRNA lysidine(34) synthetase [Treponema sp.]
MGNPTLFSLIDKAISDYSMIQEGDKILLAASGGKDSTVMAEYFYKRKLRKSCNFEVKAFHVATNISPSFPTLLKEKFEEWGIELIIKQIDVLGRLKNGKKMNCWFCSNQRRLELSLIAQELGFNKIALGHHLDDILETLLMNMLNKKSLFTMPPLLAFQKFPITIIRPLALCDTASIIRHANEQGYLCSTCTCDYQENSGRKEARRRLFNLTEGSYTLKRAMFESLKNIHKEYLP